MDETTILFDLDGTLTDPKEGILNCINYSLDELGIEIDKNMDLASYIGPPLQHTFQDIIKTLDPEIIHLAMKHYRSRFKLKGMYENVVYDGIEELLDFLMKGGSNLYVATSKPHIFAKQIISHFNLDKYFSKIYGSELDGALSDKTSLIAHILSHENINPSKCFMVGDRKYDAIGARNNRIVPIGVLWGYGSKEELLSVGVDHIHSDPKDLRHLAS